jgi:VanZ family protein
MLTATSWPKPQVPEVRFGDKLVHVALYGVLAWLVARARRMGGRPSRLLPVVVGVAAFGAVDEWHQQFIPGRSAGADDWAADAAGAALGVIAATLHARRTRATARA